jgi:HlyD family secretion protein
VGQTVAASLQSPILFTIAQDLSAMQVETSILEADIGRVQVGQPATFTVDAFATKTFHGEVVQIRRAPQLNAGVVSYNVVVSAQNPELKLLPGMTANVKIVTAEMKNVLKIPNAALRVRLAADDKAAAAVGGDKPKAREKTSEKATAHSAGHETTASATGRVHVVDADGTAKMLVVRLGLSDGAATEVLSTEIKEGQEIIIGLADKRPGHGGARSTQVKL